VEKCPCCKIYNCLMELQCHKSETAYRSLAAAVKEFHDADMMQNVAVISKCRQHGAKELLSNWFDNAYKDSIEALSKGIVLRRVRGFGHKFGQRLS